MISANHLFPFKTMKHFKFSVALFCLFSPVLVAEAHGYCSIKSCLLDRKDGQKIISQKPNGDNYNWWSWLNPLGDIVSLKLKWEYRMGEITSGISGWTPW